MRKLSHNDAIKIKAIKLAAYFHTNTKNLTSYQHQLVEELWTVLNDWKYVKNHLKQFNLED